MQLNLESQALASLLSKRVGGAEKEKDLFELPALPKKVFWCRFFAIIIDRFQDEDWSSDSDEEAREYALDAAGLGDVRDVYQVFCSLYSVLVAHPPFLRWTSQVLRLHHCQKSCSTRFSTSSRGRGSKTRGP